MKKKIDLKKITLVNKTPKTRYNESIALSNEVEEVDNYITLELKQKFPGIEFNKDSEILELAKKTVVTTPVVKRVKTNEPIIKIVKKGSRNTPSNLEWVPYNTPFDIKDCLLEMMLNIENLDIESLDKIHKSIETNSVITEFKYDRDIVRKVQNNIRPSFFPILMVGSNIFINHFNKNLTELIEEITYNKKNLFKYVKNELHNLINYGKFSIEGLLEEKNFNLLRSKLRVIKAKYNDNFFVADKKAYSSSDFDYRPMEILKPNTKYKVLYVIPQKAYGDVNITKINDRGLAAPVIINSAGKPIGKLWDAIYKVNTTFKLNLPVRCLVPYNAFIKNGKVIPYNDSDCKYNFKALGMVDGKLNNKLAILIYSNVNTYYYIKNNK